MAVSGVGTIFQRWDKGQWVNLSEVYSITGPGMSREVVDVTGVYSLGNYKEFIAGMKNSGQITLAMGFTRTNYDKIREDFESELSANYQMVLADETSTTIEFEAIVTDFPIGVTVDDKIVINVTIQCTGQIYVSGDSFSFVAPDDSQFDISSVSYSSEDESVDVPGEDSVPTEPESSGTVGTIRLNTPIAGTTTQYGHTCLKVTVTGVDERASALKLEYKKSSESNWFTYSSVLKITETFAELYGLDPATTYNFRWTALGAGYYINSYVGSTITGSTDAYDSPVYIDPTWTGTKSGTQANPYSDFPTLVAGNSYLLKRGTTLTKTTSIQPSFTNISIGAYGTGAKPKVVYTGSGKTVWFTTTTVNGNACIEDVDFYADVAGNAESVLQFGGTAAYELYIINCFIQGGFQGIRPFGCYDTDIKIIGCEVAYSWSDGIFPAMANNNATAKLECGYCYVHHTNRSTPNYPNDGDSIHEVRYVYVRVHHCFLDQGSQSNKFCFIADGTVDADCIIEYCTMTRASASESGIILYVTGPSNPSNGFHFRYNIFKNSNWCLENRTYKYYMYGNTFFNISLVNNSGEEAGYSYWYNNTIYNCTTFVNNNGEQMYLRNNIFHTMNGSDVFDGGNSPAFRNSDYNCYYNVHDTPTLGAHDITSNPLFVNPAAENFSLASNSPCRNAGTVITGYTKTANVNMGSDMSTVEVVAGASEESEESYATTAEFWQNADYAGTRAALGPGSYNVEQIHALSNLWGGNISSIKPNGYTVTVYSGDDFTGNSLVITDDIPDLSLYGDGTWNDAIYSIIVSESEGGPGGGGGTTLSTPTAGTFTIITQTSATITVSGVDERSSALKLEYKKNSSSTWVTWSDSMLRTETYARVYGLDAATAYNFRWTALGDGITYSNSNASAIINGSTDAYDSPVYIDPTWTGTKSGTIDAPYSDFPTMQAGYSYLLKRGTTLTRSATLNMSTTGITIGAYGTGMAPRINFTGTGKCLWFAITTVNGNINVQDIEIHSNKTGSAESCIQLGTTGNITVNIVNCYIEGGFQGIRAFNIPTTILRVIGCEVCHSWSDGIFVVSTAADTAADFECGYCFVHDVDVSSPNYPSDGDGIHIVEVKYNLINHCDLDHFTANDKFALIINSVGAHTSIVEYCNLNSYSAGICLYSEGGSGTTLSFRHNVIRDGALGFMNRTLRYYMYGNTFKNLDEVVETGESYAVSYWYNNTIYNCPVITTNNGEDMIFRNNIFHTVTGAAAFDLGSGGASRSTDYNCFYNVAHRILTLGAHDITSDPKFVAPTSGNFQLQSSSPCKGTGTVITGYTKTSNVNMGSDLSIWTDADSANESGMTNFKK